MIRAFGIFERAFYHASQHAPFHIVGVLRLKNAPLPNIVQKALATLQQRQPLLATRVQLIQNQPHFTRLINPSLPFQTVQRRNDQHWQSICEHELAIPINPLQGPLFRCTYLQHPNQPQAEIILTIAHIIADAASLSQLMHELMETCLALSAGNLPAVTQLEPAPTAESRFPAPYQSGELPLIKLKYALTQMREELNYRLNTINKRKPPFHKAPLNGHILPVQFPASLINPFGQRARKNGTTLNSALNAALLLAVNKHLYNGQKLAMQTCSFANLRPYLQPPLPAHALTCSISMLRYTVDVDAALDFWQLAKNLHTKIYASLKHGDKFTASLLSESLIKSLIQLNSVRMGATALNFNGNVAVQPSYGKIKVTGVHGFVSAHPLSPEMASQAQLFNNQLFWDFAYHEGDMDEIKAQAIVAEVEAILTAAIK